MPLLVETMNSNYKSATRSSLRKWRLAQSTWINPGHFALSSAVGKTFPLLQVTWATSLQFPRPIQIPIWCCQGCIQHSSAEPSLLPASEAQQRGPVYSWKGPWLTGKKKKKNRRLCTPFLLPSHYMVITTLTTTKGSGLRVQKLPQLSLEWFSPGDLSFYTTNIKADSKILASTSKK